MSVDGSARGVRQACIEAPLSRPIAAALAGVAMIFVFVLGSIAREHAFDVAAKAASFERSEAV